MEKDQARIVAVITARGGSKRIPRKNIKDFCGKPIMAYSIQAALESGIFDEVMVSTDDAEIAQIAVAYGAKIPFMRSAETANDYATTNDVLQEVLKEYGARGREFDYLCCIYPTAPFVTAPKLRDAFEKLHTSDADSIMPVVQYSFPPQRAQRVTNGYLEMLHPENFRVRSQDLEPIYYDVGQFYFMTTRSLLLGSSDEKKKLPLIVSALEVQDIDNEEDWALAEMKYRLMGERG